MIATEQYIIEYDLDLYIRKCALIESLKIMGTAEWTQADRPWKKNRLRNFIHGMSTETSCGLTEILEWTREGLLALSEVDGKVLLSLPAERKMNNAPRFVC